MPIVCFAVIYFQLHQTHVKFISANKLVGVHENDNIKRMRRPSLKT